MAGGRLAISESLTRSRLLTAGGEEMPLREAALVATVLTHPDLQRTARIRALLDFLLESLRRQTKLFEGK